MTPYFFHIIALNILDLTGGICGKLWVIYKNPIFIILAVLLFGTAGFVFSLSLRYEGIGMTNILWVASSSVFAVIIGYFFFQENLTPIQFGGIAIVIIGLTLLNWKS